MENIIGELTGLFQNYPYSKTIMLSLLLFAFLVAAKKLVRLNVNKRRSNKTEQILLNRKIDQYLNYIFFIILLVLWFSRIQIFFVSIMAVAAAVVIAFKELIMCITGGLYLKNAKHFKVGHRIDVAGVRGFVIDQLFLSTKVLEIGPENNSQQTTGDVISIPNSLFLSHVLKNESYFRGYCIKSFQFKFDITEKVENLEPELLKKSQEICAEYIGNAKKEISHFCEKEGILIPSVDPRTKIILEDKDKIMLLVKLPVLNNQVADAEQKLHRFVLNWRRSGDLSFGDS